MGLIHWLFKPKWVWFTGYLSQASPLSLVVTLVLVFDLFSNTFNFDYNYNLRMVSTRIYDWIVDSGLSNCSGIRRLPLLPVTGLTLPQLTWFLRRTYISFVFLFPILCITYPGVFSQIRQDLSDGINMIKANVSYNSIFNSCFNI
jgi:hypothetical protein